MRSLLTPAGFSLALAFVATAGTPATAGGRAMVRRMAAHTPAARSASITPVFEVSIGRGRLVTLATPMTDLFVANPGIADVQVRSPTQLYIYGKATGETTVSATSKAGAVIYAATIRVANNIDSMQSMLTLAMPESHVVATPLNGLVLLTGTVAAPADAAEAERLVQAYVGADTKVLSRLKTATPLQVNLQVRIAEVSRSFIKNIGSRLTTSDGPGSTGFLFGSDSTGASAGTITYNPVQRLNPVTGLPVIGANGQPIVDYTKSSKFVTGAARTTLGIAGKLLGTNFLSAFDLGETIGQVSTLANPNLSCTSGESCSFLAGGEIPIPISQGLGAVSVEYKQYGISLSYSPTVLGDGRISLRVRPEVSQLSSAGAVQLNGTTIPALTTRRAETTLELGSGQSMMIGGLLQNTHDNSIDKTPGLGDVPVLGALFRSNGWKRNETELVIIITPYLVKPVNNAGDIALPTDGEKAPTDLDRVLLGTLGNGTTGGKRPVPTMAPGPVVAPAIGAGAPAEPLPAPAAAPEPRKPRKEAKGDAVAPGFSN